MYPLHKSIKAIDNNQGDEIVQWTMYWILFAMFVLLESVGDIFISWIPLYYEGKVCFVLWLVFPNPWGNTTTGAGQGYQKGLKPIFRMYEQSIDNSIDEVKSRASESLNKLAKTSKDMAMRKGSDLLFQALQSSKDEQPLSPTSSIAFAASAMAAFNQTSQFVKDNMMKSDTKENKDDEDSSSRTNSAAHIVENVDELLIEEKSSSITTTTMLMASPATVRRAEVLEIRRAQRNVVESSRKEEVPAKISQEQKVEKPKSPKKRTSPTKFLSMAMHKAKSFVKRKEEKDEKSIDDDGVLLTQFKMLMVRGVHVKKYGQRSGPKSRLLKIDPMCSFLTWEVSGTSTATSPRPTRQLALIDIVQARPGNDSPGFTRTGDSDSKDLPPNTQCFSLVTRQNQLLELETLSKELRNLLLAGFRLLLSWKEEQVVRKWRNAETLLYKIKRNNCFEVLKAKTFYPRMDYRASDAKTTTGRASSLSRRPSKEEKKWKY